MTYRNVHGRKPGRGWRPYLLLPKVLAVGAYFGGLLTAAVIWFSPGLGLSLQQRGILLQHLFAGLIAPALLLAMMLGVLLWIQHPHVYTRMRWWQVKMVLLAVMLPTGYTLISQQLTAIARGQVSDVWPLGYSLLFLLVGSAALIVLGRHKPRLAQNWARTFARINTFK